MRCDGEIVTDIVVRAQGPSFGGIVSRVEWLAGVIRALHVPTDPDVVRRFLVLERGKPCSTLLLEESERILRAQPFLAEATVRAYVAAEGVRVEVVTVDEVSTVAAVRLQGGSPFVSALKLGSANVHGRGMYAIGEWRQGGAYRDVWGARLTDYQLFGRSYQLGLRGYRRRVGGEWAGDLSRPFITDLQRTAWRVMGGESHDYVVIGRPVGLPASVPVRRVYANVGGVLRVGEPGRLSLFGVSFTREDERPDAQPVVLTDSGLVADTASDLIGRYRSHRSARANALWGVRNIRFRRVRGFDALTAEQDVRLGFQLGTIFGRSISVLGTSDDDIYLAADVYAGAGSPRSFVALQLLGEGRQNFDEQRWDELLGSGRLAWYARPARRHTIQADAEWSGGWRQRGPFQLTLGEVRGGVRGYRSTRYPGARRGVIRLEDRWVLGNVFGLADAGVAFFGDAGRMWAGDVPYGVNTAPRYSLGVSLLAAVPPRSQRLWRFDVAVPMQRDGGAKVEFFLSTQDRTRTFWTEPDDLLRARDRALPSSIFTWP